MGICNQKISIQRARKRFGGLSGFEAPVREVVEDAFEDVIEEMVRDITMSHQLIAYSRLPKNHITTPDNESSSKVRQVQHGGTGFLFSSKNYVITNYHIVKEAGSILAKFANGETVEAKVVAKDIRSDIAVLKLAEAPPSSATQIKLGDSSQARMGERIFTIGYPASKIMGEKQKCSEGVISAVV